MRPKFADIQQNTEEWDQLRVGKITSSGLGCVMANYGKAFGEPAKKYAVNIALGQITGKISSGGYSNKDMERGHEQEPLARMAYEAAMFTSVKNGGFFYYPDLGCSPDGRIDDGAIEIKCAIPSVHYERIRKQSYDTAYKWQLVGNMMIPALNWIDFVSFCPDFPEDKRLYVFRLYANQFGEEFEMVNQRLKEFRALIAAAKQTILESNYQITELAA